MHHQLGDTRLFIGGNAVFIYSGDIQPNLHGLWYLCSSRSFDLFTKTSHATLYAIGRDIQGMPTVSETGNPL